MLYQYHHQNNEPLCLAGTITCPIGRWHAFLFSYAWNRTESCPSSFISFTFDSLCQNEVRITTLWVSLTLNATVALSCLLVPKVYICLFRPEKNTREAVMTRSQSVLSSSSLPNPLPDLGRGKDSPGRCKSFLFVY